MSFIRFKATTLLVGLLVCCSCYVKSWGEGTAKPGPHAANFKLANNASAVNEYTGSLDWRYNLLTVPGRGGLDVPIDLTYQSGIGCEQEAGWVGLGFGLNLGSIERSVIYIPDDMFLTHNLDDGSTTHQHDGFLFDDNYDNLLDPHFTDGPDNWNLALGSIGSKLSIVADSTSIFYKSGIAYGPAGKSYKAVLDGPTADWRSPYQHSYGLAVKIGNNVYEPWHNEDHIGDRARNAHVSPIMGDTILGKVYNYSGEIKLTFNDISGYVPGLSGWCDVYVFKLPSGSAQWEKYGPFRVWTNADYWGTTGVAVAAGDRFATFVKTRRFVTAAWTPVRIDYDVEFTDWGGYYLNPESYLDPNHAWKDGYTPRICGFTVTEDDGTTYKFETSDYIKATTRKYNGEGNEDSVSVCFDYSYKLTGILSNDYVDANADGIPNDGDSGSWVRIAYDTTPTTVNYANKSLQAFDAIFHRFGKYGSVSPVWQRHYVHYPQYVETPTHRLNYYLSARVDNLGDHGLTAPETERPKKLDRIVLSAKLPAGLSEVREFVFAYADSNKPSTFGPQNWNSSWVENEILGYHKGKYLDYGGATSGTYWIGKLTLLSVQEFDPSGISLPALEFRYDTNPHYEEQVEYGMPNEQMDYYEYPYSYYSGGFEEDWGYFRSAKNAKPGDHQRAWSLKEILYPSGAKEAYEWESNQYLWWGLDGEDPPGIDALQYRDGDVNEGDGVERGGIRVKTSVLDGGLGGDEARVYEYGEGVATKPQCTAGKGFYVGLVGNSQEVGYRSISMRLAGDPASQKTEVCFTNGSDGPSGATYPEGPPNPPVDQTREACPDITEGSDIILLEGAKRGMPYRRREYNQSGQLVTETESTYSTEVEETFYYELAGYYPSKGKERSLRVRKTADKTWQYDENGANPVLHQINYAYDEINGRQTLQVDHLGNGLKRRFVTEYLHNDPALNEVLEQRHLLTLVRRRAVQEDNGSVATLSETMYEYADFGDYRIYPKRRLDYRTIGDPIDAAITVYDSYDQYGNLLQKTDPAGTKTAYLWGNKGSELLMEAPNAGMLQASYNGFEDSLTFGGWYYNQAQLSTLEVYTGDYSAKVTGTSGVWLQRSTGDLEPGRKYVFSAWMRQSDVNRGIIAVKFDGIIHSSASSTTTNSWVRLEVVFDVPGDKNNVQFYCSKQSTGGVAYFDDIRIQPLDCPMMTYCYDRRAGQLAAAFDANNVALERYEYDGFGRLIKIVNPSGDEIANYVYYYSRSTHSEFDAADPNYIKETRKQSAAADAGVVVTFYDGLGRELQTLTKVSATGRIAQATFYDGAGQISAITKPVEMTQASGTYSYVTDMVPAGWTIGTALTSGKVKDYYDTDGPGPDCEGYAYTQYTYSAEPLRRIKETAYPGLAWKSGSTNTKTYEYKSNLSTDVDGWPANTLQKVKTTDEDDNVTYQYHDQLGRVVQHECKNGSETHKTRMVYDVRGNLLQAVRPHSAGSADVTDYQYDELSRLTRKNSPDDGLADYLYDPEGNLRFVRDAMQSAQGAFIYYKYDPLSRKVEEGIYMDYGGNAFAQTNADNPAFPSSGQLIKFSYAYDSAQVSNSRGRLASWISSNDSRQRKYDELGRVVEEMVYIYPLSWKTIQYGYDWQGNMIRRCLLGGLDVYYTYDSADRLLAVGTASDADRWDELTYWPTGKVRKDKFRQNATTVCQEVDYCYNPRDWLLSVNNISTVVPPLQSGDRFAEEYDYLTSRNGNIDGISSKHSGQSGITEALTYDGANRLTRWHQNGQSSSQDHIYAYDYAGNFLTHTRPGPETYTFNYVSSTNRLDHITIPGGTLDYSWDANGNLTAEPGMSFSSTYRNQTSYIAIPHTNWTNSLSYFYDADKQRIKKYYAWYEWCSCDTVPIPDRLEMNNSLDLPYNLDTADTANRADSLGARGMGIGGGGGQCKCQRSAYTAYLYSYDGQLIKTYVNGDPYREYIYAGDRRIAMYRHVASTDQLYYYLADHLGSARCVVDSAGSVRARYDYLPYGPLRDSWQSAGATEMRYTGKEYDEEENVNQHYFGARFLHETMLRFTAVDPLAEKYPGLSPYVYAAANPVRNYDPDGEAIETIIDIASIGFSAYDLYETPSWENVGLLLADVGGALIPFVPAVGIIRHAGKLEKVADVLKRADKTVNAAKAAKGVEKTAETAKAIRKATDATPRIRFSGTRNPKIANAAMRGQVAHKAYNPGSDYIKEYRLPSGARVDAIDLKNNIVRELKPGNPKAIEAGTQQLEGYVRELQRIYGGKWTGILDTY